MKIKNIYTALLFLFTFFIIILVIAFFYQNKKIIEVTNSISKSKKIILKTKINNNKNTFEIVPVKVFKKYETKLKQISKSYHKQFASFEILKLNLRTEKNICPHKNISFLINYKTDGKLKRLDFTKRIYINMEEYRKNNIIFFPVYYTKKDENIGFFYSLIFHKSYIDCYKSIEKIKDVDKIKLSSFSYFADNQNYHFFEDAKKNYGNNILSINDIKLDQFKISKILDKDIILKNYKLDKKNNFKFNFHAIRNTCDKNNCSFPNECYNNRFSSSIGKSFEPICSVTSDFFLTNKIFLKKNDLISINGKIINGIFKINIISDSNLFYDQIINKKGKFNFLFKSPENNYYQIVFSNFNDLYNYTENNFLINNIEYLNR